MVRPLGNTASAPYSNLVTLLASILCPSLDLNDNMKMKSATITLSFTNEVSELHSCSVVKGKKKILPVHMGMQNVHLSVCLSVCLSVGKNGITFDPLHEIN